MRRLKGNGRLSGILCAAAVALGVWQSPASAVTTATATYTAQQVSSNSYQYSFTLTNTGDTPIDAFWFGWVPAYDLLPSHPTSIFWPSGWSGIDAPDAFGIASVKWTTSSPLQPTETLGGFTFDSPDSPSTISGPSNFVYLGSPPVNTSYVYTGAPEISAGSALAPQQVAVPEPASALLLLPAALLLGLRRRQPVRI